MNIITNNKIREAFIARMKELNLNQADIFRDAVKRATGMNITKDRLSRYIHNKPCGLREDSVMWLCVRYGIPVKVVVGKPVYDKESDTLSYVIPPYDEESCLKELKVVFKKKKIKE